MVGRAVLNAVYDGNPVQLVQASMLSDEVRDKMERMTEYGYTSKPHPGAQALVVCVGGDRGHGVVIATGDARYRLVGLADGEVALYDDLGQVVHLKRDGILVKSPMKVRIDAQDIEMHASKSWSWDVNGFGERWTYVSGVTWQHKTWQTGATVVPDPHSINPPEGP